MKTRGVVSGAGVISPIGGGLPEFTNALFAGTSGFGVSSFLENAIVAGEVRDFQPQRWLGTKGIRTLDRSSRLLCVATHLALENSNILSPSVVDHARNRYG